MNKYKESSEAYSRSKKGLSTIIHGGQCSSSNRRNLNAPLYSSTELYKWLISQPLYHQLHQAWVESCFESSLKPSVDRVNDYEGYSFSNIQLMTWGENQAKGSLDRKEGRNNKVSRAVIQFTKGMKRVAEYHSTKEAERVTGVDSPSLIKVAKGKRKSAGGFFWQYKHSVGQS